MFTLTDYYSLIDFNGYVLDAINDYCLPFSETITGLYNNFMEHTSESDQQAARNFLNVGEASKQHVMELINMWAYDSISHGI